MPCRERRAVASPAQTELVNKHLAHAARVVQVKGTGTRVRVNVIVPILNLIRIVHVLSVSVLSIPINERRTPLLASRQQTQRVPRGAAAPSNSPDVPASEVSVRDASRASLVHIEAAVVQHDCCVRINTATFLFVFVVSTSPSLLV